MKRRRRKIFGRPPLVASDCTRWDEVWCGGRCCEFRYSDENSSAQPSVAASCRVTSHETGLGWAGWAGLAGLGWAGILIMEMEWGTPVSRHTRHMGTAPLHSSN